MKKILIIGPLEEPITGVTVSNDLVLTILDERGICSGKINMSIKSFEGDFGTFSFKKMIHFITKWFQAFKIIYCDTIYITPGQTFSGILKYAPYIIMARILGKKVVTHIHGNILQFTYSQSNVVKKSFMKFLLGQSHRGIVLSESLKKNLEFAINESRIHCLSNFVTDDIVFDENEIKCKDFNVPKIIFLSNLVEGKGVFVLLEALKIIESLGVEYECQLAGNIDVNHREELLRSINDLKHTRYLGVVKGRVKRELLLWGNIFVLPALQVEGLPISILEAMSSGCMVATTTQDSLSDLFSNEELKYIERGSVESIVDLVKEFRWTEDSALRNNHHVNLNFTEEHFQDQLLEIIH
ncbi:glycosyltransferase family 4 protein [Robertkochia sediminum]|uniref:glycosyltransferase family 4 protein n=1 Tax=Robertkochia sediminum TaxID=2785326 RepID=UPI0019332AEC|nr:glycosyltransferase family 4 protein [Robertkochia sediminum]MBL7471759.1 glycosyltransferase family 4 protein [Robertkochia sediminum]